MARTIKLLPLLLAVFTAIGAEAQVQASEVVKDVELQEQWRTSPDEEPYFRSLSSFFIHQDELYVLDKLSTVIYVYTLDGELLRTMDVRGEGPGELQGPTNMMLLSETSIGIMAAVGPKLIIINTEGEPSYEFNSSEVEFYTTHSNMSNSYHSEFRDGKVYIAGEQGIQDIMFLASYDLTGFMENFYLQWPSNSTPGQLVLDEKDSFLLTYKPWCTGERGRLYASEERCGVDEYQIVVFEDSQELFSIIHPYTSRRRSSEEKEQLRCGPVGGTEGYKALLSMGGDVKVDDYDQDIIEMVELDEMLWVRTSRSEENEGKRTYDLFNRPGKYQGQAHVHMVGVNWNKDVAHFINDYVVLVKGEFDALNPGTDVDPDPLQFILAKKTKE